MPRRAANLALTGALLMDLALASRVDSSPDRFFPVRREPTGGALPDELLERASGSLFAAPRDLHPAVTA